VTVDTSIDAEYASYVDSIISFLYGPLPTVVSATAPSTTSTLPPSTTTSLPYPTSTAVNEGTALCWSDYNSNGQYVPFTQTNKQDVVAAFCNNNYVLAPGNTYGYVEGDATGLGMIYATISWAEDQSGCGTEQDLDLSSGFCLDAWDADFACKSLYPQILPSSLSDSLLSAQATVAAPPQITAEPTSTTRTIKDSGVAS
jgi:hypothetical protein